MKKASAATAAGNRSSGVRMPGIKPGIDKPTGRVVALIAIAVIARLRDPRAAPPRGADLSDLLGTGKGRPNWHVMLIGLAVIVAWLLILMLLVRLLVPPAAPPSAPTPAPTAPSSAHAIGPPP